MPTPQIQNPAGAFGLSSLDGYTGDDRPNSIVNMRAAVTTIIRGDLVALSTSSGYVIRCLTDTAAQLVVGVALNPVSTVGEPVEICTGGPVYSVRKDTASTVTAGNMLGRATTDTATVTAISAATAVTQAKDTGLVIGLALANAATTATTVDIFVAKF